MFCVSRAESGSPKIDHGWWRASDSSQTDHRQAKRGFVKPLHCTDNADNLPKLTKPRILQRYVFQLFNNAFLTVTINCFFWVWVYSVWVYMSMKWGHYALGYNVIMSHQRSGIILESPFRPRQGEETVTPVHPQGREEAWTLNIAVKTIYKVYRQGFIGTQSYSLFFITILGVCIKLTISILTICGSLSLRTW